MSKKQISERLKLNRNNFFKKQLYWKHKLANFKLQELESIILSNNYKVFKEDSLVKTNSHLMKFLNKESKRTNILLSYSNNINKHLSMKKIENIQDDNSLFKNLEMVRMMLINSLSSHGLYKPLNQYFINEANNSFTDLVSFNETEIYLSSNYLKFLREDSDSDLPSSVEDKYYSNNNINWNSQFIKNLIHDLNVSSSHISIDSKNLYSKKNINNLVILNTFYTIINIYNRINIINYKINYLSLILNKNIKSRKLNNFERSLTSSSLFYLRSFSFTNVLFLILMKINDIIKNSTKSIQTNFYKEKNFLIRDLRIKNNLNDTVSFLLTSYSNYFQSMFSTYLKFLNVITSLEESPKNLIDINKLVTHFLNLQKSINITYKNSKIRDEDKEKLIRIFSLFTDCLLIMNNMNSVIFKNQEKIKLKIIKKHYNLVQSMSKNTLDKNKNINIELNDLIQEGLIGLITSIERFEPDYGYNFKIYANFWIRQGIQKSTVYNKSLIKVPANKFKRANQIHQLYQKLSLNSNHDIIIKQISDITNLDINQIYDALYTSNNITRLGSLEQPVYNNESNSRSIGEYIESESEKSTVQIVKRINELLNQLPKSKAILISMKYGIYPYKKFSVEELSRIFSINPNNITQTIQNSFKNLKNNESKFIHLSDLINWFGNIKK